MSLVRKPIFWVGVVALGAIAWVATTPEQDTKSGITARKFTAKKSTSRQGEPVFVKEDYDAKFELVNIELKNSFQPIVARRGAGLSGGEGQANAVPPDFTGGETGWFYTGSAEIDGVRSALLEHRPTGEGAFLKTGERWKSAMVAQVLADSVVMKGPSGTKTFSLVNEERIPSLAGGFAPLPVAVSPEIQNRNRNNNRNQNANTSPSFGVMPGPGAGVMTIPTDGGGSDFLFAPGE